MHPDIIRPFGPVVETPHEGAFLTEHPVDVMLSGNFTKVPAMMGFATREGMLSEIGIRRLYGEMKMFKSFEKKVPFFYNLKKGSELSLKVANMIKEFYYGKEEPTLDNLDKFYIVSW